MSHVVTHPRRFRVRARHEETHHGRLVSEPTFEAAAMAYVEHLAGGVDVAAEIGVIVRDVETGHEHAFMVHLDQSGAAMRG